MALFLFIKISYSEIFSTFENAFTLNNKKESFSVQVICQQNEYMNAIIQNGFYPLWRDSVFHIYQSTPYFSIPSGK